MHMVKNKIDDEAKRAADKIRAALEEFSKETGLSAQVNVRWLLMQMISESRGRVVLDYVSVQPEHPDVRS